MHHLIKNKIARRSIKTIGVVLLVVVLLPLSLYIPVVQNAVVHWACNYASDQTGMDIKINRILLEFPLDVSIDGVSVVEASGDTMMRAQNLTLGVELMPLLDFNVKIGEARLSNGYYHMISTDSATVLSAQLNHCLLQGTDIDLKHSRLNLLDGQLSGGRIHFDSYPHKAVEEPDTAAPATWHINAYNLRLKDIDVTMTMMPTIDTLRAYVGSGQLRGGIINLEEHSVTARSIALDSVNINYRYPSENDAKAYSAAHPLPPDTIKNASDTVVWTIQADSIGLNRAHVLYALRNHTPTNRCMDMDYLELSNANILLTDLYNRGSNISLSLNRCDLGERCGLKVESANGRIEMDSTRIDLTNLRLKTFMSDFFVDAHIPLSLLNTPPKGAFRINTRNHIALQEIALLHPSLYATAKMMPLYRRLSLNAQVDGTPEHIGIKDFKAEIDNYLSATAQGSVDYPLTPSRLAGNLSFDAKFHNLNVVKPYLLDRKTANEVNFPPLTAKGSVIFGNNNYRGNLAMTVGNGTVAGEGSFNGTGEAYNLDLQLTQFPVKAILPGAPVDDITAHVSATGQGFDFNKPSTSCDANIHLAHICYGEQPFNDILCSVNFDQGSVLAQLSSANPDLDLNINADGQIRNNRYTFNVTGNIQELDTKALGLTDFACCGKGKFSFFADYDTQSQHTDFNGQFENVNWTFDDTPIVSDLTDLRFTSNDSTISAYVNNEDTYINFSSPCSLNDFLKSLNQSLDVVNHQITARALDVAAIQNALPPFDFELNVGNNGIVPRYLERYDIDVRKINCKIRNDSTLLAQGYLHRLSIGETAIDTISLNAQASENHYLVFNAHMGNRAGTWDDFAQVDIRGGAKDSTVDFLVEQRNIKREMGFRLGIAATLSGENIKCRLFPEQPIIGYHGWTINKDNHINYNLSSGLIDANFAMRNETSSLALHTEPAATPDKEYILLNINNLLLNEWVPDIPTLSQVAGAVNSDMKLLFDGKNIEGDANMSISNLIYDGSKMGNIEMKGNFAFDPETSGTRLNTEMNIDGSKVMMAFGTIAETDSLTGKSPFNLNLQLNRFPLAKADAFVPGNMVNFSGYLNGSIAMDGDTNNPQLNGYIESDSAVIDLPAYGCKLRLSDSRVPVNNGIVVFNNYQIIGINDRPITLSGQFNTSTMAMDLRMAGKNVQLIGANQKNYSEVFGKGYTNIDASVAGTSDEINIKAKVALLATSNVTYVMQNSVNTLATSAVDKDMVTFVNSNDSTASTLMLKTSTASTSSNINVDIEVEEGAKINAYLSTNGNDRVSIEGSGRLRYSLDFAGKDNLTGVFTIHKGNVRYAPPVISQKNFDIKSGSKITWTGDMFNPTLNLTGTETVRTSVTSSDGGNRLINFLITAKIGNTLSNMALNFDMSTDEDTSIKNELQSMTETQRSNAAINMLLYNTYSGLNSSADINISANGALYSFLQSQLNSWASKTLKGVDLSFGINEYNTGNYEQTQMSYSYRLSKSLFNDRFKIVVGGEYSTATEQDQIGNNLFSDISLEYYLNNANSRYLRLFRHTGWESVLEGEITEMGLGFALKRKAPTLRALFGIKPKRPSKIVQPADTTVVSPKTEQQ